jgi:hypothetical protein
MTMQLQVRAPGEDELWDSAASAANAWRGHAIQIFAQAEQAVSKALEALASVADRGMTVRRRRLVGQRFEDLAFALAGPFAAEGEKAAVALLRFREHESLRPFLCHGVAKLARDRNGRWLIVIKVIDFRARSSEPMTHAVEEQRAGEVLAELRDDRRALASALQSLQSRLGLTAA